MAPLRVVVGCYDGTIHGWESEQPHLQSSSSSTDATVGKLRLVFAYTAHRSCVKTLTMLSGSKADIMVSGGTDELLRIYNLQKKKEVGELSNHQGSVESVAAIGAEHILSGGKDGLLCVWKTAGWECIHELKGHKPGQVTGIAVHPKGRVAFSTSRDNSLRLWDLSTGKPASRVRIDEVRELTVPCWSPSGNFYAVVGDGKTVYVYDVDRVAGTPIASIQLQVRVNDLSFIEDERLAVGCEDGKLRILDKAGVEQKSISVSEKSRVKAVEYVKPYAIAATSSGSIQVWNVEDHWDLVDELQVATDANLTCMAVSSVKEGSQPLLMKKGTGQAKRGKNEDSNSSPSKRKKPDDS